MKVHFLGAAETVTGSKFLIELEGFNIMIDCGLFQGEKALRLRNWEDLPFDVKKIDVVLLTHGHIDHVGYLPRLIKKGFRGRVIGTDPTLAIAEIILLDSAKIQEESAERANKEGYSKHQPALPLYTLLEAEKAIAQFESINEGEWMVLYDKVKVRFQCNGHILGSTFIELEIQGKRLVFSGDVGRKVDQLLFPPEKIKRADYLFIESTYGDRIHPNENLKDKLNVIIKQTLKNHGNLIIPSFAVERAQLLIYLLWQMMEKGEIPKMPVVLDSPMGINVLNVFNKYRSWHKLPLEHSVQMSRVIKQVVDYKETWEVIDDKRSKIVIAGSGMVTGGRVLTYLKQMVSLPQTNVLIVGFQAEGTRGRALLEGAKEIQLFGKSVPVKATIFEIEDLSAHADQRELLDWLQSIENPPKKTFIIHGEKTVAEEFKRKLEEKFAWDCFVPALFHIETINLEG